MAYVRGRRIKRTAHVLPSFLFAADFFEKNYYYGIGAPIIDIRPRQIVQAFSLTPLIFWLIMTSQAVILSGVHGRGSV